MIAIEKPAVESTASKEPLAQGARDKSASTKLADAPASKTGNTVALNKQTPMPDFPDFDPNAEARGPIDSDRTSSKTPNMIDQLQPEASSQQGPSLKSLSAVQGKISPTVVASLPTEKDIQKELARRRAQKTKGQMVSVNSIFEVKNQDVPLYIEAGYTKPTGVILPIGTKGKATFKVTIGDDEWFQVKSKADSGWANGSLLTLYDMAAAEVVSVPPPPPVEVTAKTATPLAAAAAKKITRPTATPISEATYFEPTAQGVEVYKEPSDRSEQVAKLEEGVAYLGSKTTKLGVERWFYVEVTASIQGWVRGTDLQLASMILPPPDELPESDAMSKMVAPAEDGVPVYNRPTITAKKVRTLSKGESYKVLESDEMTGNEWLKVEFSNKKQGWVQAMFVTVKNPSKK